MRLSFLSSAPLPAQVKPPVLKEKRRSPPTSGGGGSFDLRRRVNSTVRWLKIYLWRIFMADPRRSIELLDQLEALGFTNDAYRLLHHSRARGWKDSIARHRAYCEKVSSFQRDGDAERDQRRLEFVLRKYVAGAYP